MAGYLKIAHLSRRTGTDLRDVAEYQVNYTVPGVTYVIAYDELKLRDFLLRKIGLEEDEYERVMSQLRRDGHSTIGDVDFAEESASAIGMEMVPDDF